jgi:hypothetical protein
MTKDAKRGRPAQKVVWTNQPPPTRRHPPSDIMSKREGLSPRAQAAVRIVDIWGLFFTPEMMMKVVRYTNEKIQETMDKNTFSRADLKKKPHIKSVDLVSSRFFM